MNSAVVTIIIGRNEGLRFQRCLASALGASTRVVYVDSGSNDGSPQHAAQCGATVVALDNTRPFTAARARNAGLALLLVLAPATEFVQFIDGDCELAAGWLPAALAFMRQHSEVAAACGRRRERFPQASVYNQLCDIEWNTPIGAARACGGDVLMRVSALQQVGGYRADLIAGEEPELCVRLRAAGWQVHRLDADMTWHDAAMTRFGQWWQRSKRAGHAFAEGYALHGTPPERHCRREVMRPWFWAAALPLAALLGLAVFGAPAILLLAAYPVQLVRQALRQPAAAPLRWRLPVFQLIGKAAELQGQLLYWWNQRAGRNAPLIEYKL